MTDLANVNTKILKTVDAVRQASLTGEVISCSGAGKAYQSVAQSSAIAIQDATDQLRNFGTIGATAAGVAVAQMLATGDVAKYTPILKEINTMLENSANNYSTVGKKATGMIANFPTGASNPTGANNSTDTNAASKQG